MTAALSRSSEAGPVVRSAAIRPGPQQDRVGFATQHEATENEARGLPPAPLIEPCVAGGEGAVEADSPGQEEKGE